MPPVILEWAGKTRPSVQFNDKKVMLTPTQSKPIYRLHIEKPPILFDIFGITCSPMSSTRRTKPGRHAS